MTQERADTSPVKAGLPRWARWCDSLAVVAIAVGTWIGVYGSIIYRSESFSLTARSPARAWVLAVALIVIRHFRYPFPSLLHRIGSLITRAVTSLTPDAVLPARRTVLQVALGTRLAVIAVGVLATVAIGTPPDTRPFGISDNVFINVHARWDAAWYSGVALHGYEWLPESRAEQSIAFFPGYPFLMNLAGNLLTIPARLFDVPALLGGSQGRMVLGGVLVSLIAFPLALLHLYALARLFCDDERACTAAAFLAAYPYAVYFSAPLTESVFLLAIVAAFYYAEAQQFGRMAGWGFVAGIVRPNGFLLTPALVLLVMQRMWSGRSASGEPYRRRVLPVVGTVGATVAMLGFSAYVWDLTGEPFTWAAAQQGWGLQSRPPWLFFTGRLRLWSELGTYGYSVAYPLELLKLACVSLTVVFSLIAFRFGAAYAVWPLLSLMPSLWIDLPAIGRMTAVLFPAFLALATSVSRPWHPALLVAFALFQALIATLFYTARPPW